jgi:hypothetical protein
MHGEFAEPLLDRRVFAGKEACPNAVSDRPQSKIEAGGWN